MKANEIKLHFQKLNEQRLQFAISDDLKKSVDILNMANLEMLKSISNYDTAYKNMMSSASKGEQARNAQGKITGLAETKAKELGVSVNTIPGYSEALKAWSTVDSTIDKINEF